MVLVAEIRSPPGGEGRATGRVMNAFEAVAGTATAILRDIWCGIGSGNC